jgi:hypothetical protein
MMTLQCCYCILLAATLVTTAPPSLLEDDGFVQAAHAAAGIYADATKAHPHAILVVQTNLAALVELTNLMCRMDQLHYKVLVVTHDAEVHEIVQRMSNDFNVVPYLPESLTVATASKHTGGGRDFAMMAQGRFKVWQALLQLNYTVWYMDLDVMLYEDPWPSMAQHIDVCGLQYMHDFSTQNQVDGQHVKLNTGYVVLSAERKKPVLDLIAAFLRKARSYPSSRNQNLLWPLLEKTPSTVFYSSNSSTPASETGATSASGLTLCELNRYLHITGRSSMYQWGLDKLTLDLQRLPTGRLLPTAVHFTWARVTRNDGHSLAGKIAAMQFYNVWFLDPAQAPSRNVIAWGQALLKMVDTRTVCHRFNPSVAVLKRRKQLLLSLKQDHMQLAQDLLAMKGIDTYLFAKVQKAGIPALQHIVELWEQGQGFNRTKLEGELIALERELAMLDKL